MTVPDMKGIETEESTWFRQHPETNMTVPDMKGIETKAEISVGV